MLIAAIATVFSCNAFAQKLSVNEIKTVTNGTANLTISLDATELPQAASLNIHLPEGVTIAQEDGEYDYKKGDLVQKKADIRLTDIDDYVRLQVINTDALLFKGMNGTIATLPLVIGNLQDGSYEGYIDVIKIANHDAQPIKGSRPDKTLEPVKFSIVVDNTATGINGIQADELAKAGKVFNLQGQRVNNTKQGGLYIVNGKKVIVK